jgi:hypothetical protein
MTFTSSDVVILTMYLSIFAGPPISAARAAEFPRLLNDQSVLKWKPGRLSQRKLTPLQPRKLPKKMFVLDSREFPMFGAKIWLS